jgi:hypothetical protein
MRLVLTQPALADQSEIEGKALRYVLRNLGDAVTIETQQDDERWHVTVYASAGTAPIGRLVYDLAGELLKQDSTPPETMRRRAVEGAEDGGRKTADGGRRTADGRRRTAVSGRRSAVSGQRSAVGRPRWWD